MPGNASDACGSGGAACSSCNLQSYCLLVEPGRHTCWQPSTCDLPDAGVGACRDLAYVCHTGNTDEACGEGGWPCQSCDAGGCQNGRCAF
jgi:hypothetical protein